MKLIRMIRFSMGTIMMFVLMSAAAMALFVKIQHLMDGSPIPPGWNLDVPSLFLLAIALTAVALGSWKEHSAVQTMLQVTLACVGCLSLIWIGEAQYERAIRYWCQGTFAATVTLPMLARRFVKSGMSRGPRRDWWKKTCEAIFFSFLTMMLVTAGGLLQATVYMVATNIPSTASATAAASTPPVAPAGVSPAPNNALPTTPPAVGPAPADDLPPVSPPPPEDSSPSAPQPAKKDIE
ncbi:MAG: hypothetical protein ACLQGP_21865 [Isosphaeraceae bacterium]